MKITIYELLGLVKDGKAPNKMKYDNMIWGFDGDFYRSQDDYILEEYCNLTTSLNDEVEILDKSVEEKKIPEKLGTTAYVDGRIGYPWSKSEATLKNKINEIIDYLKSKGE